MQDLTFKLITQVYITDSIGNQRLQENYVEVPIIEIQDIYQSEFYNASQQGLKPTLRLVTSNLNYNGEEELIYIGEYFTVIRVDRIDNENIALVCEKRVGKNGKNSQSQ